MAYKLPELAEPEAPKKNEVVLIASGDLRLSANRNCWGAQRDMEKQIVAAIKREGWKVRRGHPYKKAERHGFIDSQKEGMEVFKNIHPNAPLIVAEAVWQYSHHVLHGRGLFRLRVCHPPSWGASWRKSRAAQRK